MRILPRMNPQLATSLAMHPTSKIASIAQKILNTAPCSTLTQLTPQSSSSATQSKHEDGDVTRLNLKNTPVESRFSDLPKAQQEAAGRLQAYYRKKDEEMVKRNRVE